MTRPFSIRPRQLSFWLRVCTVVGMLLIVACAYWIERNAKQQVLDSAGQQSRTLSKSLAQQASDSFQMADLAVISLSRLLGEEAPTRSQLQAIEADMSEILLRVPRIRALDYVEASGWVLASSAPSKAGRNVSRNDLFRQLQKTETTALVVGSPVRDTDGGRWEIIAGRRITNPDGSFGGILTATIDASYFSDFYATFSGRQDGHAALMTLDRTVLSRYPYLQENIGSTVPDSPIFRALWRGEMSGSLLMPSPITGEERLLAFAAVVGQPMVVVFTLSTDAVLAPWRAEVLTRMPIILALLGIITFVGIRLSRQADRRQAIEDGLVELSRTDALTGLFNRRDFNETLPLVWTRCSQSRKPLSLLMIDVDCFKLFNDTYGHQAGDTCLQLVSLAVQQCVDKNSDRVIRYGGEEIAVVLPGAELARADQIAEAVRQAVTQLAILHATSTVMSVVTVSIGAATEDWIDSPRQGPGDLLDDADRALYRAKIGGRNRVVAHEAGTSDVHVGIGLTPSSLRLVGRH